MTFLAHLSKSEKVLERDTQRSQQVSAECSCFFELRKGLSEGHSALGGRVED